MRFSLATAPATEPVTSAEFVANERIDSDAASAEATFISAILKAAREHIELFAGPIIAQSWDGYLDDWPSGDVLTVEKPRVSAVASIKYYDEDETEYTLSSDAYRLDLISAHARIALKDGQSWPSTTLRNVNGVAVRFTAGWADATAVPQDVKQAIILLASHWYANREVMAQGSYSELPFGVQALIANRREWGF